MILCPNFLLLNTIKKQTKRAIKYLLPLFFQILPMHGLSAQTEKYIQGVVKDSVNGEPVSFASLQFEDTNHGTATDLDGYFSLISVPNNKKIRVSSMGYETKTIDVTNIENANRLIIYLLPSAIDLQEVVVKPSKQKYSRHNNPAVELMRKVIEKKEQNRMKNAPNLQYEQYEKLTLYWDNFRLENKLLKNKFGFIQNHLDTSIFTGKQVLTLSMRETLSQITEGSKSNLIAKRTVGAEETFNDGSMDIFLAQVFREVDIYDDNLDVLLNKFVSPTSSSLSSVISVH